MADVDKAYRVGYIAARVMAKAHHMKRVGKWDFCNPDEYVSYVSEEELLNLKESAHIPYCSICGKDALFKSLDNDTYIYALSDYCPSCGAILNPEVANKTPEDSIKEQVSEIRDVYNHMYDDLKAVSGSNEVD